MRFPGEPLRCARRATTSVLAVIAGMLAFGVCLTRGATLGWGDGVNLQPSYFGGGRVTFGWELMARHDRIRTVRVEIEPTAPLETAIGWLREAQQHGYTVIATYHHFPANGSDDPAELLQAAEWWRDHYAELAKTGPIVVNLMNEWGSHDVTPDAFAAAYNRALAVLRPVYPGPVIVDVPGWGQEVYIARDAGRKIDDANIVYSVHIYSSAFVKYGANRWMNNGDLDALAACGRPVLVGEFGALRNGGANWSELMDHARSKGWTLIAWAWNGDGEGMNMVEPYWEKNPRPERFSKSKYFRLVYGKLRRNS